MATDKKHIAVYLAPEIEQALITFCEQNGLISKKGTMYSAGVNAALAAFFGVADIGNIPDPISNISVTIASNIPNAVSTIPDANADNILATTTSTILAESFTGEELPGKLRA